MKCTFCKEKPFPPSPSPPPTLFFFYFTFQNFFIPFLALSISLHSYMLKVSFLKVYFFDILKSCSTYHCLCNHRNSNGHVLRQHFLSLSDHFPRHPGP